ncbi:MAG: AbrB/MazE/SpoVT family DNA-binding domain-containing protein [Pacificimonas sp.]
MTTITSKTFRSGNSEAVRLPKSVAFGRDTPVVIQREGDTITIRPKAAAEEARRRIGDALSALAALPKPDAVETRDADVFPDRPGL